jgi:hypothetical protein
MPCKYSALVVHWLPDRSDVCSTNSPAPHATPQGYRVHTPFTVVLPPATTAVKTVTVLIRQLHVAPAVVPTNANQPASRVPCGLQGKTISPNAQQSCQGTSSELTADTYHFSNSNRCRICQGIFAGVAGNFLRKSAGMVCPHPLPLSRSLGRGEFEPPPLPSRARCTTLSLTGGNCSEFPPPDLPRGRGRNRNSLPARGEGWSGGEKAQKCRAVSDAAGEGTGVRANLFPAGGRGSRRAVFSIRATRPHLLGQEPLLETRTQR